MRYEMTQIKKGIKRLTSEQTEAPCLQGDETMCSSGDI